MTGCNYNTVNGYNHIKAGPEAERTVVRNPGESTEKKAGNHPLPNVRHAKNENIRTVQTKTYLLKRHLTSIPVLPHPGCGATNRSM